MLSRVAESLFWMGRYLERAENYARFIDVNFNLSIDLPSGIKEQWKPLITATGDFEPYVKRFGNEFHRENAIFFLGFDTENPNAIINTVSKARENARIVRESIPRETWEVLNELHFLVQLDAKKKIWKKEDPHNCFKEIKLRIQLLNGISFDCISRTEGWYFTKLGQYLERADMTSRILDVKYHILLPSVDEIGSPLDFLHWTALLKSVSAFNSYRQKHHRISPGPIVDYLVLDGYFPRSIFYCLKGVENCLHEISESKHGFSNSAEKAIGNMRSSLEYADVNDVFKIGLHEYLDGIQIKLNEIAVEVKHQYFKIKPNFSAQTQHQS